MPNARVDRRCPGGALVRDEEIVAEECSKWEPKGSVRGRTIRLGRGAIQQSSFCTPVQFTGNNNSKWDVWLFLEPIQLDHFGCHLNIVFYYAG